MQHGDVSQRLDLLGDEWQLDARVLRWPASWQSMGIKPRYQLERISGRYRDIDQEIAGLRIAAALDQHLTQGDWWAWLGRLAENLKFLDAAHGSSAYHPLQDSAVYEVNLTNSGLISRPVNEEARAVLRDWLSDSVAP